MCGSFLILILHNYGKFLFKHILPLFLFCFDRFKDIAKKPKEKPLRKQDKTAGQTAGQKNKKPLQHKTQKKDNIQREDKPKEDKPQKKDNFTPSTPAASKKNQKKKNNEKQKDGGHQNKDRKPQSGGEKTPIKERTEKSAPQVEKQSKNEKIKGALSLEVPKTSSILLPTGTKWHSIQVKNPHLSRTV